jgi:hypothetical protein
VAVGRLLLDGAKGVKVVAVGRLLLDGVKGVWEAERSVSTLAGP